MKNKKPKNMRPIKGASKYSISSTGEIWSDFGGGRKLNPKPNATGYITVSLAGDKGRKTHPVHRLVWDAFGDEPHEGGSHRQIHHVDRNPENNCITNLKYVSAAVNSRDTKLNKSNTSGFRGVSRQKGCKNWRALTRVNGKQVSLGTFKTPEEASAAYEAKFQELIDEKAKKPKEPKEPKKTEVKEGSINNYFFIYNYAK